MFRSSQQPLTGTILMADDQASNHNEKFNGSRYPDGLRGDDIPITARVLQIVDLYDALTTGRPSKNAFPRTDALQTMKEEVAKG